MPGSTDHHAHQICSKLNSVEVYCFPNVSLIFCLQKMKENITHLVRKAGTIDKISPAGLIGDEYVLSLTLGILIISTLGEQ